MPLDDWQFYVVTAVVLWAIWRLVRPLLSSRRSANVGCPTCASGAAARRPKRTQLTLMGREL
jgi:hypothetical protein